jgi:hypothetical protein
MEQGVRRATSHVLLHFCIYSPLPAPRSSLGKLRRPCRRANLLESGFVDHAEENDKVPFTILLANNA